MIIDVREIRMRFKWSLDTLERMTGISQRRLVTYEKDKYWMLPQDILKLMIYQFPKLKTNE